MLDIDQGIRNEDNELWWSIRRKLYFYLVNSLFVHNYVNLISNKCILFWLTSISLVVLIGRLFIVCALPEITDCGYLCVNALNNIFIAIHFFLDSVILCWPKFEKKKFLNFFPYPSSFHYQAKPEKSFCSNDISSRALKLQCTYLPETVPLHRHNKKIFCSFFSLINLLHSFLFSSLVKILSFKD